MLGTIARGVRAVLPRGVREAVGRHMTDPPVSGVEAALQSLAGRGFRPRLAVDVGAYHGEWTALCKRVFPDAGVLMVEAQEGKRAVLEGVCERFGPSVELRTALLGATGDRAVKFAEMETGSSVFEEQSHFPRTVVEKTTTTLDDLLGPRAQTVDLIKLDVQGYELEVLRGATRALAHAQCVLTEASLVPVNRGCPLVAEVVRFLDDAGFRLTDFCSQIRRKDGVLWQTDLLFVRNNSPLLPAAELTAATW
jgi:FkbM family methyltransferase